jgi:hypothetical protein
VRRTLIPALVAGLIVVLAPAANATTKDLTDPSGDVMTATVDDDGNVSGYHREGGAEGDIVFARIQHTATQVVVYLRYRQLTVPRQYAGYYYEIEGNNKQSAIVEFDTRHAKPQGQGFAFGANGWCRLAYHINYAGDSVSMRIPRTCLRSPKYVRLMHISYQERLTSSSDKIYYDSPSRDGGTVNQVSNSVTPWVVTG